MPLVHILFGTESGNAEDLAQRTKSALVKAGFEVVLKDMADFTPAKMSEVRTLLVVTSTFGNGDPPYNAEALLAYLMGDCPPLPQLRFSVCGLGDTTYEYFSKCGKDFDRRLEELSGTRFSERADCDVDYEEPFEKWLDQTLDALSQLSFDDAPATATPVPSEPPKEAALGTRRRPFEAEVLVNRNLNGPGSSKETRHVELALGGSGIEYTLGDCIGIWPDNDPALIDEVLAFSGVDGEAAVTVGDDTMVVSEALRRRLDLVQLDARLLEKTADALRLGGSAAARQAYLNDHHVIDALVAGRPRLTAEELVSSLRPLAPRLYSIASSPTVHPEAVHLTIDIVRYELHGRARAGVVSSQLTDRCPVGTKLPVYLHPSPSFRLCPDDQSIVMIGPGTGVAPFRGFLQHRASVGGSGRSWLFFGSRNEATDMLYRDEIEKWRDDGTLTHLSTAFSRDGEEKVYVQHRMKERADELREWIRDGAVVYVCGDAKRMAPDVHQTMIEILAAGAGQTRDAAAAELKSMEAAGRYQRDVY